LKLWTSKELSGRWQRWTVGGSLQAQSSNFMAGTHCPQPDEFGYCAGPSQLFFKDVQGSYAAANLRVAYRIDRHWRTALTINNVFDRVYYQTIGSPGGGNWYGEPRNFMLRFDGSY
jgi:outer-membrane receptor for ferric coprogen and ferric-rhodotorulic acid